MLKSRFSFAGILTSFMFMSIMLIKKQCNLTKVKEIYGTDVIVYFREKIEQNFALRAES